MAKHQYSYRDSVVVITGGAAGIGAALARALVREGAQIVLLDRDREQVAELAANLGSKAEGVELDVRDAPRFEAMIAAVCARYGKIDYLFNNAGTASVGEAKDHSLDDWSYIVDVNLKGVIHGILAVYPRMIAQGFGHIVNTSSISGLCALPGGSAYAATKHAIVGLSRSLRIEAKRYGVRVSVLCPGPVCTNLLVGGGKFGRSIGPRSEEEARSFWEQLRPMDPDALAERVLRRVARNAAIIVEPTRWRVAWMLDRLSPRLGDWYVGRRWDQGTSARASC
jgi:NADP-dependent 3-hydroxy acid dehydrogenase YdfG